ncbi:MAG: PKD domain-containing protein [Thermoplasmata archaeon]|nr:MAG: PKD domain-containing protein [Thermoplasmata archaeon]
MIKAIEDARYYYHNIASCFYITEFSDADSGTQRVEVFNYGRDTDMSGGFFLSVDGGVTQLVGDWDKVPLPTYEYGVFTLDPGENIGSESGTVGLYQDVGGNIVLWDEVAYGQEGAAPDPLSGESVARYYNTTTGSYSNDWLRNGSSGPTWGFRNIVASINHSIPIVLNRVMFNPINALEGYVELMFKGPGFDGPDAIDISGYRIVCDNEFIVPFGTILTTSNQYYVLNYSLSNTFFSNMDSSGDNVYLYNRNGSLLDMVGWSSSHTQGFFMSRLTDGCGSYQGYDDLTSQTSGWSFDQKPTLLLTEFFADSGQAHIEVFNPRGGDKALSSWEIEVELGQLSGTWTSNLLPSGLYSTFSMNSGSPGMEGDTIKLNYGSSTLIDEVSFGIKGMAPDPLSGESTARLWDDSISKYTDDWTRNASTGPTWDDQNDVQPKDVNSALVLNEIMFNPNAVENGFVELYLKEGRLNISGYKIVGDKEHIIPEGTELNEDYQFYYLIHSMDTDFFDNMSSTGDNVYLYDKFGRLLDMAGWSSPHSPGETMCRIPKGEGGKNGFNDSSSIAAGWIFGCIPTVQLIKLYTREPIKIGYFADVVYFNMTITNNLPFDDTVLLFNSTLNGYPVEILDDEGFHTISNIFVPAGSSVYIIVEVILPSMIPYVEWDNITVNIHSENNSMYGDYLILQVFIPTLNAEAGPDQMVNEGDPLIFNGMAYYDPHWHRLDVNFATDSALYLRTINPDGPVNGQWEGAVREWVTFSSSKPFWIAKEAGHLGQGPTGYEYTYYWKMHSTGVFNLSFCAANGNFYADVYDETNDTYVLLGLEVEGVPGQIEVPRELIKNHTYRLDVYDTVSLNFEFPNDLDVLFFINGTDILLTPDPDSMVYYVSHDPLGLAFEGPGVREITFYSRKLQKFYAYYLAPLNHSEVEVGGGELSLAPPPYTTGITPGEYYDTVLNLTQLNYSWDFDSNVDSNGDGNFTNDTNAFGPTPTHIYGDNGYYTATLTVKDPHGLWATDICNTTVNNSAPVIEPFGPFSVYKGFPFTFIANASDPGSDDLLFNWNWGDGSLPDMSIFYNNGLGPDPYPSPWGTFPFSATDMIEHIYMNIGIYIINLTVYDDDGLLEMYETTVTVHEIDILPPTLYINGSQDGEDAVLNWEPQLSLGVDHYLIYRSKSQIDFDFSTVWVNTSADNESGEPGPVPLRTMWNDTEASLPGDDNYEVQYYYTIRAVNILGHKSSTSRTVVNGPNIFPREYPRSPCPWNR